MLTGISANLGFQSTQNLSIFLQLPNVEGNAINLLFAKYNSFKFTAVDIFEGKQSNWLLLQDNTNKDCPSGKVPRFTSVVVVNTFIKEVILLLLKLIRFNGRLPNIGMDRMWLHSTFNTDKCTNSFIVVGKVVRRLLGMHNVRKFTNKPMLNGKETMAFLTALMSRNSGNWQILLGMVEILLESNFKERNDVKVDPTRSEISCNPNPTKFKEMISSELLVCLVEVEW